jgi:hypothetical protein
VRKRHPQIKSLSENFQVRAPPTAPWIQTDKKMATTKKEIEVKKNKNEKNNRDKDKSKGPRSDGQLRETIEEGKGARDS